MDIITEPITAPGRKALFPRDYFAGKSYAVLDIETLGLTPGRTPAILCGLVTPLPSAGGTPHTERALATQFLVEDISGNEDEQAMLLALEEALDGVDFLITFNGRSFDIPFLEKRREVVGLPPAPQRFNLDLLPIVRHCSDIPKFTPNLKQKTLENFSGLWDDRTDTIDGRESISLYYDFVANGDAAARDKILLHNRDDIVQLFRLTDILRRADMHYAAYRFGFPCGCGTCRLLLDEILLAKEDLTARGRVVAASPRSPEELIHFGDGGPSWRFHGGRFTLSVPTLLYEGLQVADITGMAERDPRTAPLLAKAVPSDLLQDGYLLLAQNGEVAYAHCNALIKGLLERILEQWEM